MNKAFRPGTIVVRADERQLFYATGGGQALRYPQPTIVVKNEKRGFPFQSKVAHCDRTNLGENVMAIERRAIERRSGTDRRSGVDKRTKEQKKLVGEQRRRPFEGQDRIAGPAALRPPALDRRTCSFSVAVLAARKRLVTLTAISSN